MPILVVFFQVSSIPLIFLLVPLHEERTADKRSRGEGEIYFMVIKLPPFFLLSANQSSDTKTVAKTLSILHLLSVNQYFCTAVHLFNIIGVLMVTDETGFLTPFSLLSANQSSDTKTVAKTLSTL